MGSFFSSAEDVSGDGSVVVGQSLSTFGFEAFSWTAGGGMVGLGDLTGGSFESAAFAVSADGSVVVGRGTSDDGPEAFRWTAGGGMAGLGDLSGGFFFSQANGVNADGSVVVGQSSSTVGAEAFRWTAGGGLVGLGILGTTGAFTGSSANDVSADGSVVVGASSSNNGFIEAFRWTQATGMVGLGDLSAGSFNSGANAVNADGSVVVGQGRNSDGDSEAFRWTASSGMMEGLGDLSGGAFFSTAADVNADGSVVVGASISANGGEAFRWTATDGIKSVQELLTAAGVDMTGWQLQNASGVSDTGNTIVGRGNSPDSGPNSTEAWIARFGLEPGIITPDDVAQSFASLAGLSEGIASWLDSGLATHSEVARHHRCERDRQAPSPLCAFAYVEGGSALAENGETISGTVGLKTELGGGLIAGASGRAGITDTELLLNSTGDTELYSGNAFLAFLPATGFQLIISGTIATFDGDIDRVYANGAGTATSTGDTSGDAYAANVRIGWAFAPQTGITLTPFADYRVTRVEIDGWTETRGPFPAEIADINDTANKLRLGAEGRVLIGDASWLWGSLAWGHRFEDKGASISGELTNNLLALALSGNPLEQDWLEATAGVRMPVTTASAMTASVTTQAFSDDVPLIQGRVGFSARY